VGRVVARGLALADLVTTGGSRSDDTLARTRLDLIEEDPGDGLAERVVFGLVAEGAGHATTAAVEVIDVEPDAIQDRRRVVVLLDGLLLAVAVIGQRLRSRIDGQALDQAVCLEVLEDAVSVLGESFGVRAREQVEVVQLEHHGHRGFDADDVPAVCDAGRECVDVLAGVGSRLVEEALRVGGPPAVGHVGRHLDVDAGGLQHFHGGLAGLWSVVVRERIGEQQDLVVGLFDGDLRAALGEPVDERLPVEGGKLPFPGDPQHLLLDEPGPG